MAKARIAGVFSEIEQYRKTRCIPAAEATWRILGHHALDRAPSVSVIQAHLRGENYIVFPSEATHDQQRFAARDSVSDLMRYFARPSNSQFDELSCIDYFETHIIIRRKKDEPIPTAAPPGKWLDAHGNVVSRRTTSLVCRIKFQNPAVGDLCYLRLILHRIAGGSFLEPRTVTNRQGVVVEHLTFHDAARARGLISGQDEYFIILYLHGRSCRFPYAQSTTRTFGHINSGRRPST